MRISEYVTLCPTCKAAGVENSLGFDSDLGISCTANPPHAFPSLPGEPEAISPESMAEAGELRPPDSLDTEPVSEAAESRQAAEGEGRVRDIMEARKDAPAVAPEPPAGDIDAELKRIEDSMDQMDRVSGTVDVGGVKSVRVPLPVVNPAEAGAAVVALGQFVRLPNGDILCGVRVSELWVGAMQAEGECKTPPMNAAEYLQEIIELGLLEWHSSVPVK